MVRRLLLLLGYPVRSPTLWGWEPVSLVKFSFPLNTLIPPKAPSPNPPSQALLEI